MAAPTGQGLRRPTLPVAPARYDTQDQARFRQLLDFFMREAAARIVELDARITELEDAE